MLDSEGNWIGPGERPPPIHFPGHAEVSETQSHAELRLIAYQLLRDYLGPEANVGTNQYVYWIGGEPTLRFAPDVCAQAARPGEPYPPLKTDEPWKVWERAAPEVTIDIACDSDSRKAIMDDDFTGYRSAGVQEIVAFDATAEAGRRLRVFHHIEGDVVECIVKKERLKSRELPLTWVLAPAGPHPIALRFEVNGKLYPMAEERG